MPERGQYWPAYDEARKYEGSVRHATPDHPLRDAKPANDGNLYPYNSKLRPPPLWIDEDGVEIADQPQGRRVLMVGDWLLARKYRRSVCSLERYR
jgi:hypothetical protein